MPPLQPTDNVTVTVSVGLILESNSGRNHLLLLGENENDSVKCKAH